MNNKKIDWLVLTFLAKKWIRAGCFLCCPSQSTTGRMCSPPLSSASRALQKCLREPGNKLPPTTNLAILPRASTFNLSFSTFLFDGQALWVRLCLKEHFADWKLLQVAALALTVSLKDRMARTPLVFGSSTTLFEQCLPLAHQELHWWLECI